MIPVAGCGNAGWVSVISFRMVAGGFDPLEQLDRDDVGVLDTVAWFQKQTRA
jgi:hypothetical protein